MTIDKHKHQRPAGCPGPAQFPIDEKGLAWIEIYTQVGTAREKRFAGFMLATGDEVEKQDFSTAKGTMTISAGAEYWFPACRSQAIASLEDVQTLFWRVDANAHDESGYHSVRKAIGSAELDCFTKENCSFIGASGAVEWSTGHSFGNVYCAAEGAGYSLGLKLDDGKLIDAIWVQPGEGQAETALPGVWAKQGEPLELTCEDRDIGDCYAYHYNPT